MSAPSPVLRRLNSETRPHHADVDATWLDLTVPQATRAKYIDQLTRVFGFLGPLEAALAYTPRLGELLDLRERERSGLIAQDLLALGLSAGQLAKLPQCPIAPFATPGEALGWMYVSERWTLLESSIRGYIKPHVPHDACSCLGTPEQTVTERWLAFGTVLDRAGARAEVVDEIIHAAHAGFRCALDWLGPRARRVG